MTDNFEKVTQIKIKKLNEYDVNNLDIIALNKGLEKFGKTEIKTFSGNKKGPYLVIFQEIHNNNIIKKENFKAFIENKDYFNFLATEGIDKEVFGQITNLRHNIKGTVDFILGGHSELTSEAIEEFLSNEINTIGVDWTDEERKKSKEKRKQITSIGKEEIKNKSIDDMLKLKENKQADENVYINKFVKNKRNIIWLNNIFEILKTEKYHNMGKNFIPIVGGGKHAEGLAKNAGKYGFKGVIIFTSNGYK